MRVTTFPVFADGFHRRHGPSAPSRGPLSSEEELPKKREASPHSTASRASLGHRFCSREHGERSRATNQPETRPTFRDPRRPRTMRPHRDAFGRPSLVRAREDYSSACSSGTRKTARRCRWVVAVPGSRRLCDCSLRSLLRPSAGCPASAGGSPLSREGGEPTPTFRWVASSSSSAVGAAEGLSALIRFRHAPQRRGRLLRPNTFAGR